MNVILCVDDNNGMMFNNRRQSQDKVLRERILSITNGKRLYMSDYSYSLFKQEKDDIIISETITDKINKADYFFAENIDLSHFFCKIDKIILYKWNRKYPSDFKFNINLESKEWKRTSVYDFKGSSHEKITEEVYVK